MQVENDVEALFGAIQTSYTVKSVKSIIAPFAQNPNGIAAWKALYAKYGHHGAKELHIPKLEAVINTQFASRYKGGLTAWVQDTKNAFAELPDFGVTTYNDDAELKRRLLLNFSEPESSMSMVMNELCRGKTFTETCFMIRKHSLTKVLTVDR